MEKHYWKKNELLFLKECYKKHKKDILNKKKKIFEDFNKKYPNIDEEQVEKAFNEHKWLKED